MSLGYNITLKKLKKRSFFFRPRNTSHEVHRTLMELYSFILDRARNTSHEVHRTLMELYSFILDRARNTSHEVHRTLMELYSFILDRACPVHPNQPLTHRHDGLYPVMQPILVSEKGICDHPHHMCSHKHHEWLIEYLHTCIHIRLPWTAHMWPYLSSRMSKPTLPLQHNGGSMIPPELGGSRCRLPTDGQIW